MASTSMSLCWPSVTAPRSPRVGAPNSVAQIGFAPSPWLVMRSRRLAGAEAIWVQALHGRAVRGQVLPPS
jgi:hypothetical protein